MKSVGIFLVIGGVLLAAQLGSSLAMFVDLPAIILVGMIGIGIMIASHGTERAIGLFKAVFANSDDSEQIRKVADTGVTAFVAAGWIVTLIGIVQLLCGLSEPHQIGAGAAIALLAALYGYILAYAVCFPISRSNSDN